MPPFITAPTITVTVEDLQDAVDAYLAANPLDLTAHTSAADPHTQYLLESQRGVANGVAPLDGQGTIPDIRIPSSIARDSEAQGYVTTHANATDPHGDRAFATSSIATHNAATTNVHGIANTANLETLSGATNKVSAHNAQTTAVHGITDTSQLVLNNNTRLWPNRIFATSDQTAPSGAIDGDFWIAPAT